MVNQTRIQRGCLPIENTAAKNDILLVTAYQNLEVVAWLGKKIIFITQPFPEGTQFDTPIAVDYLVISNDAVRHLEEIPPAFNFTALIIDSSNRYYIVKRLLQEADAMGITAYAVADQGAYVVNFF